jgi:hypothetical protein
MVVATSTKGVVMKYSLSIIAVAAAVVAAIAAASHPASAPAAKRTCTFATLPRAASAGQQSLYGHIKSLVRKGQRFELRFDPAWLLTGSTAARAKLEDTGSSDVPNDTYTRDESHKLLTYRVPSSALVTVLRHTTCSTRVTVARLARSVPSAGFWISVRNDTARSIDQQYHP